MRKNKIVTVSRVLLNKPDFWLFELKMKKNLTLFLLLVFPLFGIAQTNLLTQKFELYRNAVIQEKLFIRTDRPAYVGGEVIWFKIYTVDASFHQLLDLSKVAYVELLDQNNAAVLQAKIELKKGLGIGSFQIPKGIDGGTYHLRSYTNWMKNFDAALFYDKAITIVNTNPIAYNKVTPVNEYDIQFFPEGGNLLEGVKSKIAFKILNPNGLGEDMKGAIVNAKNDTLVRFSSTKFGMGNFNIEAKSNESLTAVFKAVNGQVLKKTLPKVEMVGGAMNLVRNGNGTITVNAVLKNLTSKSISLFVHTRNQVCINQSKTVSNGVVSFVFEERELKDGISQLTIFDESNRPICERLYFKQPNQVLPIQANFDQTNYTNRTQVGLNITTTAHASFSVSIYKADSLNIPEGENLYNYLWLASDLKGNIEHPEFYFNNSSDSWQAADNLMLTQGWRRFNWDNVMQSTPLNVNYVPENRGLLINTILNTQKPIKTFFTILEKEPKNYFAIAEANGEANFLANFYGKKTLVFQTDLQEDSVSRFTMVNPFLTNSLTVKIANNNFSNLSVLTTRDISAQVQSKYYEQQFRPIVEDTLALSTVPKSSYNIDEYTKFPTIEESIKEYVRGVSTYKKDNKQFFRISYKNDLNKIDYMYDKALVLFDGIPDFNTDDILGIKTVNIDQISLVQEKYFDSDINMGGVIKIKSKAKNLDHFKSPNALILDYEGLQQQRTFYSPKYLTVIDKTSKMPDFRNLLYWEPNVTVVKDKTTKLNFYTADQTGKYFGVIEGLSDTGKVGYQLISFEVKGQ